MSSNIKNLSDIEKYEIININDGEKYSALSNHDIIIDENGYLKVLVISENTSVINFFNKGEFSEIPWEYVKKIGSKTIIVDIDENRMSKTKL